MLELNDQTDFCIYQTVKGYYTLLTTQMNLINGRVVGLIYEFYPVFLVGNHGDRQEQDQDQDQGQGKEQKLDMLESFVPIDRGQEQPVDWADMSKALVARGIIRDGSIGRLIKDDDMKKYIEELQFEPDLL